MLDRYCRLAGEHATLLTSHFLQDLGPDRTDVDELWAFVQKTNTMKDLMTDFTEIGGLTQQFGAL